MIRMKQTKNPQRFVLSDLYLKVSFHRLFSVKQPCSLWIWSPFRLVVCEEGNKTISNQSQDSKRNVCSALITREFGVVFSLFLLQILCSVEWKFHVKPFRLVQITFCHVRNFLLGKRKKPNNWIIHVLQFSQRKFDEATSFAC